MQLPFYEKIEARFSSERLEAYAIRAGGTSEPSVTLARYLLNMALCESLYSPLQICEIALRNSIHQYLSRLLNREDWYDDPGFQLTPWATGEVNKAKGKILKMHKPLTAGRIVAELQFGFWTSLFEDHYEKHTPFLPGGFKAVFPHLPKSLHRRKERKKDLELIRLLRNRVFHHERIIHWRDLDVRHDQILQVITWISPELHEMAYVLDRFTAIRQAGLAPWLNKLHRHWPNPARLPTTTDAKAAIAMIPEAFDATSGAATPFGRRWGGDVFHLAPDHLAALQSGQTLALDVQNEYIAFLQSAKSAKLGGLGYGG